MWRRSGIILCQARRAVNCNAFTSVASKHIAVAGKASANHKRFYSESRYDGMSTSTAKKAKELEELVEQRIINEVYDKYDDFETMSEEDSVRIFQYENGKEFIGLENVKNRVLSVIQSFKEVDDAKKITLESTFTDLGYDSLDVVEALVAIEEEFNIEIPDETSDKLKSVKDVVGYIVRDPNGD